MYTHTHTMVNIWSPDDTDPDAVDDYGYIEGVPTRPDELLPGDGVAAVNVRNMVNREGKTDQVIESHTPIQQWTDSDLSQVAYLAYLVGMAVEGVDLYDKATGVQWNKSLEPFVDYILTSEPSIIPKSFEKLFDEVSEEYLSRKGLGGARHVREEKEEEPDFPQPAIARFLNLRVWEEVSPPTWIELTGDGKWITEPGPKMPKKAQNMLANLPEGTCALRALLLSGVSYKNFLGDNYQNWVGATVQQMVDALNKTNHPFQIYDGLGRLIIRKERKECAAPPKSQLPIHKFMVGGGHVYPFRSHGSAHPLKRPEVGETPDAELLKFFKKKFGLTSSNGIDVEEFYRHSCIRAPGYHRGNRIQSDLRLDCNKAYYSILTNENNVFPIASGFEVVEEYEERIVEREKIQRTGFYRVSAMPLLTSCPVKQEEVEIFFGGHRVAWVYGDALLRCYSSPSFRVSGEYVLQGSRTGTSVKTLSKDWSYVHQLLVRTLELSGKEVTPQSVQNRFWGEFVKFTGVMEKRTYTTITGTTPKGPDIGELSYWCAKASESLDHSPYELDDCYEFIRYGFLSHTGCLAKLAVYQYMSALLVGLWREVCGEAHTMTQIMTDSVSMTMSHSKIPKVLKRLANKGWLGPHPGQFKVERNAAALGEEESRERLIPQTPKYPPRYLGCQDTHMVRREDVVEQAQSGRVAGLAVFGPAGAGKTHLIVNDIIPPLRAKGHQIIVLTPTLDNLSRLQQSIGPYATCMTLQKFLSPLHDKVQLEKMLKGGHGGPPVTIILDEVGLATPSDLNALRHLPTRGGIIVTGDHCQLSNGGDLLHVVSRLGLQVCLLEPHEKSRHSQCPKMRAILELLRDAIEQQRREGLHKKSTYGIFPEGLQEKLEAAGLPMVDAPSGRGTMLGWRRRHSTDLGGYTVHSSQGATIEGPITITDYKCDPRLLYTALSRVRSITDVEVCRTPPVC